MIEEEVPDLDVNAWYLDDGDLAGTKEQLQQAVDILLREGPPPRLCPLCQRKCHLSIRAKVPGVVSC